MHGPGPGGQSSNEATGPVIGDCRSKTEILQKKKYIDNGQHILYVT